MQLRFRPWTGLAELRGLSQEVKAMMAKKGKIWASCLPFRSCKCDMAAGIVHLAVCVMPVKKQQRTSFPGRLAHRYRSLHS